MKKTYQSPATICIRTACRMSILTGSMMYHDNEVITNSEEIMSRQSNGLWDDDSENESRSNFWYDDEDGY
ncbi:MAG: hypothetical protein K6B13_03545 [Prevotella sp.]|nr:hypothetical protein [Prevotella sp.]